MAVEHYDLVEPVARSLSRRCPWLHDELVSAGNEAIVRGANEIGDADDARAWLLTAVYRDCFDWLRGYYGKSGTTRNAVALALSLDAPVVADGELVLGETIPAPDVRQADFDLLLAEILDACPNDRYREIVLRTIAGETSALVGIRLGVSQGRVSQMLTTLRQRIEHDACIEPGGEAEWTSGTSAAANWR